MIRRATLNDIPVIKAMAQEVFPRTYAKILSPEQIDYMMDMMYSDRSLLSQLTVEQNVFLIADGRGYASCRQDRSSGADGREVYHLEKLYVLPSAQGTGLGRQLFDAVVQEIRSISDGKPVRVELNVNRSNPAVGFYEHLGMRRDRQGDFPIGEGFYMNDYIMAIDLG